MQGDTLGTRIKRLRKGRQLTQAQLAKELYLSESYVAYIETDQRNPSMDVVARIADYFHVSADLPLRIFSKQQNHTTVNSLRISCGIFIRMLRLNISFPTTFLSVVLM